MIKVKDGYAKLVGTTASGSASHILLSNGGVKAVSDFALADGTNATGTWSIDISGNAKTATTATTASKLSTVSKTAWGLTYWTSGGVPTSISGDMTGVGNINMTGSINSVLKATTSLGAALLNITEVTADTNYIHLYVSSLNSIAATTRALVLQNGYGNVGIGTPTPGYKLHVVGTTFSTGFVKSDSSDSYVLLGGGGHKLESNLSVNYAASAGNADTVDNLHASDFVRAYGTYGTSYSYDSDWGLSIVTFDPVVSGTYPENNPNITILNLGNNYARRKQLACTYNNNNIYYRRRTDSSWSGWVRLAIAGESYTKGDSDGRYYPISGNVNMSGDNKWIGSTMGGGTDYWRIGGSGTSDNGVCQITIGDNSNDYFQIVIADYTGTNYTALLVKNGGTYAPHFYENSDQRLKENIQAIINKDNIPQIKEFDWKESGEHSYGLIAQELEEQGYSELVSTKDDGYKTVNYSAALSLIVGKLLVKIKEIEKENKELRDEINNLKTNKLWQS